MCLGVEPLGFILFGVLNFLDLDVCVLPIFGKFSAISSNRSSALFSFFSFWNPCNANTSMLDFVLEVP